MLRTAYRTKPLLNGILALGFLLVLAAVAGLAATAVFRSCGEAFAERKLDYGSGGGSGFASGQPLQLDGITSPPTSRAELYPQSSAIGWTVSG